MKIAYTINGIFNSAGKERTLISRANYLADKMGHDVSIITTYQAGRAPFFCVSDKVKLIDLDVRYDKEENSRFRLIKNVFLKRIHRQRLQEILEREQFDIVDSLMDFDFGFLYKIKDRRRKIAEYHFYRYSKVKEARNKLFKFLQYLRVRTWKSTVKKYDRFVVLTHEDAGYWGNLPNIEVIPNFIKLPENISSDDRKKIVLSIGRFTYQKGFDRLIDVWNIVHNNALDWKLKIIGGGDKDSIRRKIESYGLEDSVVLEDATPEIAREYCAGSLYVMTSRYEGLPMVLLEAMSYGLPVVSYDFPCGPVDIVKSGFGSLVPNGNVNRMASEILMWIKDDVKRNNGSKYAIEESKLYTEDIIMEKWKALFNGLL